MSHKIQSATMLEPLKIQVLFLTGEVISIILKTSFHLSPNSGLCNLILLFLPDLH